MNTQKPAKSSKSKPLKGEIKIPGDKSISHRSLMLGGIAEGKTTIKGLLEGEDVLRTAYAMQALGAKIRKSDDGIWHCEGVGKKGLQEPANILDMGNSGTSTRLLTGLVSGYDITCFFTGDKSLTNRPMGRVFTPLEIMGAKFTYRNGKKPPFCVKGSSNLNAIEYTLPVASAQVKSAIMLAALMTRGTTTIIEPTPTRDHTENMFKAFGVEVERKSLDDGGLSISLKGGQTLKGTETNIPSDPSSAAFFTVAAVIAKDSDITIKNICMSDTRNGLYKTLIEMGADITVTNEKTRSGEKVADIHVKYSPDLKGIDIPEERVPSMIDEFPILSIAAACAKGTTKMSGLKELRVKESDRLSLIAKGLKSCGTELEEGQDSLTIHANGNPPKGGANIKTHLDHRIAMSFLVLGMVTHLPIIIDDTTPINTSFPGFISLTNKAGGNIKHT